MKKYVAIIQNEEEKEQKCAIPDFSLTQAGQDILKATFTEDKEADSLAIAKKIKKANNTIVIGLFEIKNYDEKTDQISYSDKDILLK